MNAIQKNAYTEGFELVATAFSNGESFNVGEAVSWVNTCLANDAFPEALSTIERDASGDIAKIHKVSAPRAEICGYRLAGVFVGLESVRAALLRKGVTIAFNPA